MMVSELDQAQASVRDSAKIRATMWRTLRSEGVPAIVAAVLTVNWCAALDVDDDG